MYEKNDHYDVEKNVRTFEGVYSRRGDGGYFHY